MSNIQLGDVFDASVATPELTIIWDVGTGQGANLPEAYFDAVVLSDNTNAGVSQLITSIRYKNVREITVVFSDFSNYLADNSELQFTMSFPDRALFIDCSHSGQLDQYLLNVDLGFDANHMLTNTIFTQTIAFGSI